MWNFLVAVWNWIEWLVMAVAFVIYVGILATIGIWAAFAWMFFLWNILERIDMHPGVRWFIMVFVALFALVMIKDWWIGKRVEHHHQRGGKKGTHLSNRQE